MKKRILWVVLFVIVAVQFVRPTKNEGELEVPSDISTVVQVPMEVKAILRAACYDCHSNRTTYPWYSNIMPFGWWLGNHVKEGKGHLNFSEFTAYSLERQDHKLEETEEEVKEREMPLKSYLWVHSEAKLNETQVKALVEWVEKARMELNSKK